MQELLLALSVVCHSRLACVAPLLHLLVCPRIGLEAQRPRHILAPLGQHQRRLTLLGRRRHCWQRGVVLQTEMLVSMRGGDGTVCLAMCRTCHH